MEEVEPGRFTASTEAAEQGLVRLRSGDLTAVTASGPLNPREFTDLRPDPEGLSALADASGGGVFMLGSDVSVPDLRRTRAGVRQAGPNWAGLQRNEAYVVTSAERTPLAPGLLLAILLMGLLGGAWRREGR